MALKTTTKPFAWGKNYNRQKSRQQIKQTLPTHGRDERLMPLMRETATEPGVWAGGEETGNQRGERENGKSDSHETGSWRRVGQGTGGTDIPLRELLSVT